MFRSYQGRYQVENRRCYLSGRLTGQVDVRIKRKSCKLRLGKRLVIDGASQSPPQGLIRREIDKDVAERVLIGPCPSNPGTKAPPLT